jgi:hypothetical protein
MIATTLVQAALAQCILAGGPIAPSVVFPNTVEGNTQMPMTWDGTYYYAGHGGSNPMPMTVYDGGGAYLTTRSVGMDFRAVFGKHDGSNTSYFRGYASNQIRSRTPGVGGSLHATLSGGSIDAQAAVAWDAAAANFVVNNYGIVNRWDDTGAFLGTTKLIGFGVGVLGESGYPQGRGVATSPGGCWLTYASGTLSSWDASGNRVSAVILSGAGATFDSHFGYGYTNNLFWVPDSEGGSWRGYAIGL